ncbi:unnamed protein product, partial [Clonostachys byssicola]
MASTTDAFTEILIKTRMKEQNDKKRHRLVVSSSEEKQGSSIEGIAKTEEDTSSEEVVIIVELDPELNPDFALLMVYTGVVSSWYRRGHIAKDDGGFVQRKD